MFTEQQQKQLKDTVRPKIGEEYQSTENNALSVVIEKLRFESPEKFLTEYSMEKRVFFHQPRQIIPMAGYKVRLKG